MGVVAALIQILGLVGPVLENELTGGAKNTVITAEGFLKIAQAANAGYQAHTGQPIDPTLLQPIDKV